MLSIEKETYINFNDAELNAVLCTYNAAWLRKMDDLSRDNPCVQAIKRTDGYGEYSLPKKWVKVNPPRQLSEERKQKLVEQLRVINEAKKSADL